MEPGEGAGGDVLRALTGWLLRQEPEGRHVMKLVIVGGVAGGASAAARARRLSEDAEIILFERGPDVSFANCGLPYYLGGEIADRATSCWS